MREINVRAWYNSRRMVVTNADFVNKELELLGYNIQEGEDATIARFEDVIIEQYSGLHDKNGKEIYEGDIVKYESSDENAIAIVSSYYGNNLYFCWQNVPDVPTNADIFGCKEELEIIGNIHENPELING